MTASLWEPQPAPASFLRQASAIPPGCVNRRIWRLEDAQIIQCLQNEMSPTSLT